MQSTDIRLKPSTIAITLILAIWLGAILFILKWSGAAWIRSIVCIAVFFYGIRIFITHGLLRHSHSIVGLKHLSDQHWLIKRKYDEFIATLTGDSTVTSLVCVLRFKRPDAVLKYSYVLFYDAFEPNYYRQLLLRLRCFRSP